MDVSRADVKNNASKRAGIAGEVSAEEGKSGVSRTVAGFGAGGEGGVDKTDVGGVAGGKTDVNKTAVGSGAGSRVGANGTAGGSSAGGDRDVDRALARDDGDDDIFGAASPLFWRALPEASHLLESELSLLVREHEKLRLELDADREARRTLDDRIKDDEEEELIMGEKIRQLRAGEREARGHIDRTMQAYPREALKQYVANQIRHRTGNGIAGGGGSLSELISVAKPKGLDNFLDDDFTAGVHKNLTALLEARALVAHHREPLKRA